MIWGCTLGRPDLVHMFLPREAPFMVIELRPTTRVIVIAGPASSGKTTLAQALLNHRLPQLAEQLGLDRCEEWTYLRANRIHKRGVPSPDRLIYHYCFLRPFTKKVESYALDPALQLLDGAGNLSLVTVWTTPDRLKSQFYRQDFLSLKDKPPRAVKYDILKIYDQPANVVDLYRRWFEFCDGHFAKVQNHFIVECDEKWRFISRAEWEASVVPFALGNQR